MTTSEITLHYADETSRLTAARVPVLALLFAGVFAMAWVFEYFAHPERMALYAVIFSLELSTCVGAVVLTRRESGRPYSVTIVTVTCVILFALIGAYNAILGAEAEIMALAIMYLVTAVTVGTPLGGWGQLPIAVAAVLTYVGAVSCGAKSVTSVPLTVLGLASISTLSVVGAILLDRYRYVSFERTEELREANAALAKANEAKNLFLANVSHELRTPLNVILGYVQLMTDESFGAVPEELRQPLERVLASTQNLVSLISDLLDLSRIEAGRLLVRQERVELQSLFAESTTFVQVSLQDKPVQFVAQDPGGLAVMADRDRVRQVLVNLLSNAAKFTADGEIRLAATVSDGRVQITVNDTGIGIAAEDLPHIFEPFHRASNARPFGGVGMGLSISVRLARAMNGDIAVQSTLGHGATFTLSLRAA